MTDITFMQTSDTVRYAPLLELGSRTVKAYIAKFGYNYINFIGVKRGHLAWHASFNRIPMLMEMVETGHGGWVCYMDADAYINDFSFDLARYLADKNNVAFIGAHSGVEPPSWFDVNNGVFLLNLSHAKGVDLVKAWYARLMAIPNSVFEASDVWSDIPNDQFLLHAAMQEVDDLQRHTIVDMTHPKLLNFHNGRFIRQILREGIGTVEERAEMMASDIKISISHADSTLSLHPASIRPDVRAFEESFVRALYRTFLLRDPGIGELDHAVKLFRLKHGTLEQEMRGVLSSAEFAAKSAEFLRQFIPNTN